MHKMMHSKTMEYYVKKILKTQYPRASIMSTTKKYIVDILYYMLEQIVTKTVSINTKKILDVCHIELVLPVFFKGCLLDNIKLEGYANMDIETLSSLREVQIFSHTFSKHLIERCMIPSYMKVSQKYCIFISSLLEYICAEILDVSWFYTHSDKRMRINPLDMYNGIMCDSELSYTMKVMHIDILLDRDTSILSHYAFNKLVKVFTSVKISNDAMKMIHLYVEHEIKKMLHRTETLCNDTLNDTIHSHHITYILKNEIR